MILMCKRQRINYAFNSKPGLCLMQVTHDASRKGSESMRDRGSINLIRFIEFSLFNDAWE